jgi:hypothetical protein
MSLWWTVQGVKVVEAWEVDVSLCGLGEEEGENGCPPASVSSASMKSINLGLKILWKKIASVQNRHQLLSLVIIPTMLHYDNYLQCVRYSK